MLYVKEFPFVLEGAGGPTGENKVSSQNCSQEPQVQYKSSCREGKGKKEFVLCQHFGAGNRLAKHLG